MNHPVSHSAVAVAALLASVLPGFAVLATSSSKASSRAARPGRSREAGALAAASAHAPTIVLVHGAFADSSSWDAEVAHLTRAGYPVISFADPLRGVAYDSESLEDLLDTISGPVVLVGHSYAGMVISQVAAEDSQVNALVYVAAFIPKVGESVNSLNSMFPGSELVPANLNTTAAPDGLTNVYIDQDKYGQVYAGGLSPAQIGVAAATQRPVTAQALADQATAAAPASTPKWVASSSTFMHRGDPLPCPANAGDPADCRLRPGPLTLAERSQPSPPRNELGERPTYLRKRRVK